jgi:hypothetical protein
MNTVEIIICIVTSMIVTAIVNWIFRPRVK